MVSRLLWRDGRGANWPALTEALLLGGSALLLLLKAANGTLAYYIHPRFTPLVVACAVVLLLVMAARLRAIGDRADTPPRGRWAGYLLLSLPLVVALVVPARPLGADALHGTTFGTVGAARAKAGGDEDSRRWDLLQWATAVSVRGMEVRGREADVVGFVYHDPTRPLDGFFLARLVIVCCVADGSGVSLPVVWPKGAMLPKDGWVRVRGTLGATSLGGRVAPALLAESVELIAPPASPYLYP